MEASASAHAYRKTYSRRPKKSKASPVIRWVKEWVTLDLVATGGKCRLLKWVKEATLKAMEEEKNEPEIPGPEPDPTSEVLFLCSHEGCGKTFVDAAVLRKHSRIHGPRQYVCDYEDCGKTFPEVTKLKRHFLVHSGRREYACRFPGCSKAFSLEANLKSHMKTHCPENYVLCHYPKCGRRFLDDFKLRNHIAAQHDKNLVMVEISQYNSPVVSQLKQVKTPKPSTGGGGRANYNSPASDRPFVCPYEACGHKAYMHAYKLNLHLKAKHPGHFKDRATAKMNVEQSTAGKFVDVKASYDEDAAQAVKLGNGKMQQKQSRAKPNLKSPSAKMDESKSSKGNFSGAGKYRLLKGVLVEEVDSEETEDEKKELEVKCG